MGQIRSVPCDGCTACCQRDLITLHLNEGDNPANYPGGVSSHSVGGRLKFVLKHKPEGGCHYLGPTGCTIYDKRPVVCRSFDCRRLYVVMSQVPEDRRKALIGEDALDPVSYERGKELAPTLSAAERRAALKGGMMRVDSALGKLGFRS